MASQRRKLKLNLKKFSAIVLLVIFAFTFCRGFVYMLINSNRFALVQSGSITQTISVKGFIIRDEHVINAPISGVVACNYRDGERVNAGSLVASILTGDIDETLQIRLNKINVRISKYQASNISMSYFTGNSQKAETQIASEVRSIISSNISGNLSNIPIYKEQLYTLVEKNSASRTAETLAELVSEREELERSIATSKKDLYSPISGLFISRLDGCENLFSVEARNKLLPSDLSGISVKPAEAAKNTKQDSPVCKIVNNYEWHYATVIDSKIAKNLKLNSEVSIQFPSISDKIIKSMITNISAEEDGKNVIIFTCDEDVETLYLSRAIEASIVLQTYEGLKIEKSAIRVLNGETGIFIVDENNKAKFKKAEVLFSNDSHAIIKEDTDSNHLKLYDEAIIGGKNITEGKNVR